MSTPTEQAAVPRMAIMTVDDDPAVSRAVARDLRRRYGEQYRIVRAESAKRVASVVGEGAMAVMLVHRYLEKL